MATKVLHVTECLDGGVLTSLRNLCSSQLQNDFEVHLIVALRKNGLSPEEISKYLPKGVHLNIFEGPMRLFILAKSINRYMRRNRISNLHLHSSIAGGLGRLLSIHSFSKINVIYTAHGFSFLKKDVSVLNKSIYLFIEKFLSIFTSTFAGVSESELQFFQSARHPWSRSRSILLKNIISHFTPCSHVDHLSKNGSKLQIITVGRLVEQKRPDRFANLANEFSSDARFVWIGDGGLEYSKVLKDCNVELFKKLPNNCVRTILKSSDIFVLVSDFEGLPMVLLEAMDAGLPCLTTNVPGNYDLINNWENGVLVEPTELNSSLKLLISNKKLRESLSKNAKSWLKINNYYAHKLEILDAIYKK